jgi:predicted GIY-YIG superfamily endonuclease
MYFVYLIESLKDGRYYIGQTNNLEERLNPSYAIGCEK